MKTATRHFSQTTNGLTRTVMCVDRTGPDSVILFTDFDLQDNLLRQVRFEHLKGTLAKALFTEFALDGRIEEQGVCVRRGRGRDRYVWFRRRWQSAGEATTLFTSLLSVSHPESPVR
jgi:hypothetical protein